MKEISHILARWLIALSLVVMSIAGFASNQLLDEDSFAGLITNSVDSAEVRELLATKAVDIAIDASDADALLADALPENLALIATPALELSKPAIAEAGVLLLGLDTVEESLDAAARSVHRQTATAISDVEETDVVVNALPVLVVVADQIAGDVGARAAVGLELPESATSINLGSNQSVTWTIVRAMGYVAAAALLVWLLAMVAYFVSAQRGQRLNAARRLGFTFAKSGLAVLLIGWALLGVASVALQLALSPGDALTFGSLSFGGVSDGGGMALAEVVFDPLLGSGRRSIIIGLVVIGITYVLGGGALAVALREAVRSRETRVFYSALQQELPAQFRRTQRWLLTSFVVLLLSWPQITLRATVTLTVLFGVALLCLAIACGRSAIWLRWQELTGIEGIEPLDATERSPRAAANRRWLAVLAVLIAVVWPTYDQSSFTGLMVLIGGVFALTYRWELKPSRQQHESLAAIEEGGWSWRQKAVVAAIVAAGVAAIGFGGDNTSPGSAAGFTVEGPALCNGHAELCDRRLTDVAFAGTHNSMSASELGWDLANHEGAIPAQLRGGIRALLIDVQYWPEGESLAGLGLDPEAAEIASAALQVDEPPEDGLWMCHKLCQLGGTPFVDFLADLRVFLETNPDEVLLIVIQDDAPAADIKAAIELAEIDNYAYAHAPTRAWPTLGDMIEANHRLVFMTENDADDSGWYQLAYAGNVSETGFRYSVIEDFDCAESRGGNDGDFFMINHWVETGLPIPSEAEIVNSHEVLRDRVDQCVADRGRRPGIVAVNFWERGDLLEFVDELNEVGQE